VAASRKPPREPGSRPATSSSLLRHHALRRERLRVLSSDLTAVERGFPVREECREHVAEGAALAMALLEMQGDDATPARRALIQSVGRLTAIEGLLVRRLLSAGDSAAAELASRVATVAGQRARILSMLGLEEERADALDVTGYAAALRGQNRAPEAQPAPEVASSADCSTEANAARGTIAREAPGSAAPSAGPGASNPLQGKP
jgi:hypothetical protein